MAYMTISEVSKKLGISARMLRYYEQMGMIQSIRLENYAYRVYDDRTVLRIDQIILLRKLQIPLKKIRIRLDGNSSEAVFLLKQQLLETQQGMAAMQMTAEALQLLIEQLQIKRMQDQDAQSAVWLDSAAASVAELLPFKKHQLGEAQKLTAAEKQRHIRVVLLPSFTAASYLYTDENPEEIVGNMMDRFIRSEMLYEKKPDARLFGFCPFSAGDGTAHTYANWVSIPKDMPLPPPLSREHFDGGLYAAYTIDFPDFYEWEFLKAWANRHPQYRIDEARLCLEEHLNWVYSSHMGWPADGIDGKVDLLLPIKPR